MTPNRWDDDERGRGVADGRRLEPGAGELLDALREPDWVAEAGEDHLLPHLRRACERGAAIYSLIGEIAESATYIRQRRDQPVGDVDQPIGGEGLFYEVATGMLAPDTRYAPHGHVLVLRVNGAFGGG